MFEWIITLVVVVITTGGPCGKPTVADPTPPHSEQGRAF